MTMTAEYFVGRSAVHDRPAPGGQLW